MLVLSSRAMTSLSILGALCLTAAMPGIAAAPPANRTYFTLMVGLEGPYSVQADCLGFTATEMCTQKRRCGTWRETESTGSETGIAFDLTFSDNDVEFRVESRGRVDARGKKDSLAGVARLSSPIGSFNFGYAGRSTSYRKCFRFLRDFNNSPLSRNQACMEGAVFDDPTDSAYVLPYPIGASASISQSYCFANDSHRENYAYDFRMPLGSEIVAARSGTVRFVEDSYPDDPEAAESNSIIIDHDDGTEGLYGHFQQNGALVEAGDRVGTGDVIGYCGNSSTGGFPHLHFEVLEAARRVPVSFRNANGPVDERGGLMFGYDYTAASY